MGECEPGAPGAFQGSIADADARAVLLPLPLGWPLLLLAGLCWLAGWMVDGWAACSANAGPGCCSGCCWPAIHAAHAMPCHAMPHPSTAPRAPWSKIKIGGHPWTLARFLLAPASSQTHWPAHHNAPDPRRLSLTQWETCSPAVDDDEKPALQRDRQGTGGLSSWRALRRSKPLPPPMSKCVEGCP